MFHAVQFILLLVTFLIGCSVGGYAGYQIGSRSPDFLKRGQPSGNINRGQDHFADPDKLCFLTPSWAASEEECRAFNRNPLRPSNPALTIDAALETMDAEYTIDDALDELEDSL